MKKYRPYFTISELQTITDCLKSHPTPTRLSLVQYLERFLLEINHGVRKESYIPTPTPTISQKLGFEDTPIPVSTSLTGEMAHQKHLIDPTHCTPKEIEAAMEYRYTNDLMSKDEENEYEKSLGLAN